MTLRELGYSIANLLSNIEYYFIDMFVTLFRDPLDLQISQIIILLIISGIIITIIIKIFSSFFGGINAYLDNLLDRYKFSELYKNIVFSFVYLILSIIVIWGMGYLAATL